MHIRLFWRIISLGRELIFGVRGMALESLKAEIEMLLETLANTPHDRYELYVQLKEKLNEFRVFGNPPPQDLLELEAALDEEFAAARHPHQTPHPR
jgi:hypothetical protein